MTKLIPWLVRLFPLAFIAGACGVCWWAGLPIWGGLIIGVVVIAANALLLRWEDDQPGGFSDR